ncbi:MAG: hypothetical protein WC683_02430 [bacterium]
MNKHGGIFNALSSLGCAVGLGADAPIKKSCTFATGLYSEGAKAIQQVLISRGATKLKADGLWGPCSESAFEKVTGGKLTQASILAQFNISCSPYIKNVIGTSCSNGTDAYTPPAVSPDDISPNIPPTEKAPPVGTVVCPPGTDPIMQGTQVMCQAPVVANQPPPPVVAPVRANLIPGVPNMYLGIGVGVLVLGGLAYFMLKPKTAAANRRRHRRHHR